MSNTLKTVILHVGLSKTGTSYLQSCFAKQRLAFAAEGLTYPTAPSLARARQNRITSGNATALAKWLNPECELAPLPLHYINDFIAGIRACPTASMLYSSEFLSLFTVERLRELSAMLAHEGVAIRVVGYYRSLVGDAWSNYCQGLKRHRYTCSFEDYLDRDYQPSVLDMVRRLAQCVDRDQVVLRDYDVARDALFSDFTRHGLCLQGDEWREPAEHLSINRSLTGFEVELLRQFNRQSGTPSQNRLVSDALVAGPANAPTHPILPAGQVDAVAVRFGAACAEVSDYLGGDASLALVSPQMQFSQPREVVFSDFETATIAILSGLANELVETRAALQPAAPGPVAGSRRSWRSVLRALTRA